MSKENYSVYKYTFKIEDEIKIEMPRQAKILRVGVQDNIPCIWALVNTLVDNAGESRYFILRGTGHEIKIPPKHLQYIGSIDIRSLVFHLFEI